MGMRRRRMGLEGEIITYPDECSRMDGVDLFPFASMRRRILRDVEGGDVEVMWEEVKVRTSEEGIGGCRTEVENEALRKRDAFIRHHTRSKMDVSQILDLNPMESLGEQREGNERMKISMGHYEEEGPEWRAPICVCITPCPCYMIARNHPTRCDLPNGHISPQMPKDKLERTQRGEEVVILEVHWDNTRG
jgi:hypothetical protein